jgi:hypothetical protein
MEENKIEGKSKEKLSFLPFGSLEKMVCVGAFHLAHQKLFFPNRREK